LAGISHLFGHGFCLVHVVEAGPREFDRHLLFGQQSVDTSLGDHGISVVHQWNQSAPSSYYPPTRVTWFNHQWTSRSEVVRIIINPLAKKPKTLTQPDLCLIEGRKHLLELLAGPPQPEAALGCTTRPLPVLGLELGCKVPADQCTNVLWQLKHTCESGYKIGRDS